MDEKELSEAIQDQIADGIAPGLVGTQRDVTMTRLLIDLMRPVGGKPYAETWRERFVAYDVQGKPIEVLDQLLDEVHAFGAYVTTHDFPEIDGREAASRTLHLIASMVASLIVVVAEQQVLSTQEIDTSGLENFLDSLDDVE